MSDLEKIEKLKECYIDNQLLLNVLDKKNELSEYSLREIQLNTHDIKINFVVFDEYKDTEIENPVLWLNLIIDTCQAFEEAEDFERWVKSEGYPDNTFIKLLYDQYTKTVPEIRKIIGADIQAIDYHHFEFNTDLVNALREYKI